MVRNIEISLLDENGGEVSYGGYRSVSVSAADFCAHTEARATEYANRSAIHFPECLSGSASVASLALRLDGSELARAPLRDRLFVCPACQPVFLPGCVTIMAPNDDATLSDSEKRLVGYLASE